MAWKNSPAKARSRIAAPWAKSTKKTPESQSRIIAAFQAVSDRAAEPKPTNSPPISLSFLASTKSLPLVLSAAAAKRGRSRHSGNRRSLLQCGGNAKGPCNTSHNIRP